MKPALFIARRYLFSQKKRSVINVISWISLIGIAISSMALIVVLSVYNGIGTLTQSLFNIFDPELKITSYIEDGAEVQPGDVAFVVEGRVQSLLQSLWSRFT